MMKFLLMMIFMMFLYKNFWLVYYLLAIMCVGLIFSYSFSWNFMYISYYLGCDLLSFIMILLSLFICSLMILASVKIYLDNFYYELFIFLIMIMFVFLYMTFSCMNFFVFYLFFEMSMIPMMILIMGWGYQPERLQAGIYLLFYTFFMSLPMMISIFYYYYVFNTLFLFNKFNLINNVYMFLCMNMVFLVKMPMFMLHLWLPKAHVEAPVAGSMILAGVLLKLGGYGLMRLASIFINVFLKLNFIFITISMVGGLSVSLICLRQTDIKSLIAYSSVSHMSLVLGGIMSLNCWGMNGALVTMVAHGLCSSGLFCLANIIYERLLSRSLFLNKGLMNLMPNMSFWWFLLCCCNMSAPSLNLLGEIMLINSLLCWSKLCLIFLSFMLFFSVVYSMYLYSYTQHGQMFSSLYVFSSGYIREYLLLFLHWFPLIFLILKSECFMLWI